jgi:hypothetical protein
MSLRGVSGAASTAPQERGRGAQIVVVRPDVVENGGHIFGNLFQRMYHSIERVRDTDRGTAEELEGSTRQLEQCLQLLLDYVSPYEPAMQFVKALEVVRGLASQLADATGSEVTIGAKLSNDSTLLLDPGRLAKAFRLLATCLPLEDGRRTCVALTATIDSAASSLHMLLRAPGDPAPQRSSLWDLQWAVAERLLEIHGGSLAERAGAAGEVQWEVALPLQP